MIVECAKCHERYEDALRTTICPHKRFLSEKEAAQKDLAHSLLGERLRFAHQADVGPDLTVSAIDSHGMVAVREHNGKERMGWFAPHLFVVAAEDGEWSYGLCLRCGAAVTSAQSLVMEDNGIRHYECPKGGKSDEAKRAEGTD